MNNLMSRYQRLPLFLRRDFLIVATLAVLVFGTMWIAKSRQMPRTQHATTITVKMAARSGLSSEEEKLVAKFEAVFLRKATIVETMQRIDRHEPLFAASATRFGISQSTLEGITITESGGNQYAYSVANCAGPQQFCVRTARSCGLNVSGLSRQLYLSYRGTRDPALKRVRAKKLKMFDERYDPAKSTPAAAFHLATLKESFGGDESYAVAAYHAGSPNIFKVNKMLRKAGIGSNISWGRKVVMVKYGHYPETKRFLFGTLKDDSAHYYFKVMAAKRLVKLWHTDKVQFYTKILEQNPANRTAVKGLLQELKNYQHPRPRPGKQKVARSWQLF